MDVVMAVEGMEFASENNLHFFEASAVTGYNVKEIFEFLIQQIYNLKSRLPSVTERITSFNSIVPNLHTDKINKRDKLTQLGCLEQGCFNTNCNTQ